MALTWHDRTLPRSWSAHSFDPLLYCFFVGECWVSIKAVLQRDPVTRTTIRSIVFLWPSTQLICCFAVVWLHGEPHLTSTFPCSSLCLILTPLPTPTSGPFQYNVFIKFFTKKLLENHFCGLKLSRTLVLNGLTRLINEMHHTDWYPIWPCMTSILAT